MNSINSNPVKSKNLGLFIFFILTINFLIILNLFPQVTEEWVARYNGLDNSNDGAYAIAIDSSKNIYVTGYSGGLGTYGDYATIKYDNGGIEQWIARYDGPANGVDWARAIAVDSLGNVYVTGESAGLGTSYDYATIKYNNSGIQQWVARYNSPGNNSDEATAIAVDNSGNVYVTGSNAFLATYSNYETVKYDKEGIEQWVAIYNGSGNSSDYAYAIAIDNSGNVYVTGSSYGGSGTSYDYATIKYNNSGIQQWVAIYDDLGNGADNARAITVDILGNIYVTGESKAANDYPTDYDCATIKYNSEGIEQWVTRYNGSIYNFDYAKAIVLDNFGNVYITGTSGDILNPNYLTIKYNNSGVEQWVGIYNGPGNGNDYAYAIALDNLGNVYVTGTSSGGSGTSDDYATIKYNSSGLEEWMARYNGLGNFYDKAYAIALDSSGNVYVTGESAGSGISPYNYDYATIKYSQGTSISDCIWSLY